MKKQNETVLRRNCWDYVTPDNYLALCTGFVEGILKVPTLPCKIRLSIRAMSPTAKQGKYHVARRFDTAHVRFGRKTLYHYYFIGRTLRSIGVGHNQKFWFKITAIKP